MWGVCVCVCVCGRGQLNPEPGDSVSTQEVHIKENIDSVGIYENGVAAAS